MNKLINMAVETSDFALELLQQETAADARALLEVGSGGGGDVASVNGQSGVVVLTAADVGAATAAQGVKADTALQPGDAPGAITSVNGYTGVVTLGASDVGAATSAQGALADTAVQPGDLADVATSGSYDDLSDTPDVIDHTSGALASRPSSATTYSTYYATDVRETYRWDGASWELISGGGVVLASVALEASGLGPTPNSLPITNHDFGTTPFAYVPNAPSLIFTCGTRPFTVELSGSMLNGDASAQMCVQLEVNGTVYTQLLYMNSIAGTWMAVVRKTKPLTFAAGTLITCRIRGVMGGTTDGQLFCHPTDPLQIVAMSV